MSERKPREVGLALLAPTGIREGGRAKFQDR